MTYDSTADTKAHIARVQELLMLVMDNLDRRATIHDKSKLQEPEKSVFDAVRPKLRQFRYGSPEYQAALDEVRPALDHHYANNSHHPEYYPNGVDDMSLLDVLEMFCDWKAAGEVQVGGSLVQSIEANKQRFGLSEQLWQILENTRKELNW